jgi:hypothetical protein
LQTSRNDAKLLHEHQEEVIYLECSSIAKDPQAFIRRRLLAGAVALPGFTTLPKVRDMPPLIACLFVHLFVCMLIYVCLTCFMFCMFGLISYALMLLNETLPCCSCVIPNYRWLERPSRHRRPAVSLACSRLTLIMHLTQQKQHQT